MCLEFVGGPVVMVSDVGAVATFSAIGSSFLEFLLLVQGACRYKVRYRAVSMYPLVVLWSPPVEVESSIQRLLAYGR